MVEKQVHDIVTKIDWKDDSVRRACISIRKYQASLAYSEAWMSEYAYTTIMLAKKKKAIKIQNRHESNVTSLLSRLETRTRQLMLEYDKLKQQLAETRQQLSMQQQQCVHLEEEKRELEEKYARLKMAKMIDMADDDNLKTTRQRINKMIASVDRCLATLKAQ